jgi:phenolphthiocerol/phthiocerol/phthiodiolone dimycocerosyl transferase
VFPTSVIRKLARSEEMFARSKTFFGSTIYLKGPIDVEAMTVAFETLLEAHPVLAGQLECGPDGMHQIVVDDLAHPGIWVVEGEDGAPGTRLDHTASLADLRLKLVDGGAEVTLFTHHSLTDGYHNSALMWELFSWYTDVVCTGRVDAVVAQPAPEPLEVVLEERGVRKQSRSGVERFMPAMFAYDLPSSTRDTSGGSPAVPTLVPAARCRLTKPETEALIAFTREHRLSLNAVIAAAILLAEWKVRGTAHVPIPYLYIADLRLYLSPPVDATACTNPLGVATYLAEIGPNTDIARLAGDIVETFRQDLADGVIQQSLLHFDLQYAGTPSGLPEVVMATHLGSLPAPRTPPDVRIDGAQVELYAATVAGIDYYVSMVVGDELQIDRHSHSPGLENTLAVLHSMLCAIPFENEWITE